ncbi:hypothetical protein RCL1_004125 [Eukaryota sp. TZLM3-RCL]
MLISDPNQLTARPARLGLGAKYIPPSSQKKASDAITDSIKRKSSTSSVCHVHSSDSSSSEDEACSRFKTLTSKVQSRRFDKFQPTTVSSLHQQKASSPIIQPISISSDSDLSDGDGVEVQQVKSTTPEVIEVSEPVLKSDTKFLLADPDFDLLASSEDEKTKTVVPKTEVKQKVFRHQSRDGFKANNKHKSELPLKKKRRD